ncbi:MAG: hypothetical protein KAI66_27575, partial [Lentisphaeria bacterium]|nr:hypothetical protein [Lentisphaeria bacterium]
ASWILNPAYPGKLHVLSDGARSGKNSLRISANGERAAHIFQPCDGLAPGARYKVSAWVRGGRTDLLFYQYDQAGSVPTVMACSGKAGAEWRQISAYYVPSVTGFKSASLALVVRRGEHVDIDEIKMEACRPVGPVNGKPIMFENELISMRLSSTATLESFKCKSSGAEYATPGNRAPLCHVGINGAVIPARALKLHGGIIDVAFADPDIRASFRITARGRYFRIKVIAAQPADIDWLTIDFPLRKLATQGWAFAANYDDTFGTCGFALDLQGQSRLRGAGTDIVTLEFLARALHGIKGAGFALLGSPRDEFNTSIQHVERDNGLPCPILDGKWVRESEPIRRSYLFAVGMHEKDTDALIECAKIGHFQTIHILKDAWLKTHGHYEINTGQFPDGRQSFKRVAAKIHAAGLKVGVHLFGPSISPNDPYVTPVPDDRLLAVDWPPLAEDVVAGTATLTLTTPPTTFPPAHNDRSRPFPLRLGDELVRYGEVDVGPPFRFLNCQRGAYGTTATPHRAGTPVRGLRTMVGFFMIDPDSSLLDEITSNFADIVNDCGLDMVYFDASDGGPRPPYADMGYYLDKCHLAFYRKFDHDVLYQTSNGTLPNLGWHIVARSASADGHGDIKLHLDERLHTILGMKKNFIHADVGWYGLDPGSRPDRIEYICAKCLGADGSISVQTTRAALEADPHAREIIETIGRYERCRLANVFPESVKAQLLEKKREFKLFDDGKGGWTLWHAAYEPDRVIIQLDGKQNEWTIQNDLPVSCRLAVEITRDIQHAVGPDYDSPNAIVIEDFEDLAPYEMSKRNQYEKFVLGKGKTLTDQGPTLEGVTQSLERSEENPRAGKACGVFKATNSGLGEGWSAKGKRFTGPLDLSSSRGLAMWIKGDAKNAVFMLQLLDTSGRNHQWRRKIDFKGWRLEMFRIPVGADFNWRQVEYILFYYNNIPGKTTVACGLDDLKALPGLTRMPMLSGVTLTVNGKISNLPGEIGPRERLTTDGLGTCTVWPGGMKPGRKRMLPETAIILAPGTNRLIFSCDLKEGFQPDVNVNVRLIKLWPVTQ